MGCPQSVINFSFPFPNFFLSDISLSLLSCRIYYFLNFGITQSLSLGALIECVMMHNSIQQLSRVRLFGTPQTATCQTSLSITNSQSLFKLKSIIGDAIQPSHRFLLLPSILPNIRVFSNESALCIRWPKYWSFSFSISPSNEYSGQIFFRMDWLDLLAVQGTLKSLLQHHSSKASVLWYSAFFIVHT